MAKCVGCGLTVSAAGILEVDLVGNGTTGAFSCTTAGADPGLDLRLCTNGGIVLDSTCGLKISFPPSTDGGPTSILPLGSCLQTDGTGKVNIKLNPDVCNSLKCDATTGLNASCLQNSSEIDQAGFVQLPTGASTIAVSSAGLGKFRLTATKNWKICNQFCCGAARGLFIVEGGGPVLDNMSNNFLANLKFEQSFDSGATFGGIFPEHIQWFDNRGRNAHRESFNLWHETFKVFEGSLNNKGACFTYTPSFLLTVLSGTATLTQLGANGGFELHLMLMPSNSNAVNPCSCAPNSTPASLTF